MCIARCSSDNHRPTLRGGGACSPAIHSPTSTPTSRPSTCSKLPRLKVHHPHILNQRVQTRHKLQVRRVLLKVVLPVILVLKLANKAVCEGALGRVVSASGHGKLWTEATTT